MRLGRPYVLGIIPELYNYLKLILYSVIVGIDAPIIDCSQVSNSPIFPQIKDCSGNTETHLVVSRILTTIKNS